MFKFCETQNNLSDLQGHIDHGSEETSISSMEVILTSVHLLTLIF